MIVSFNPERMNNMFHSRIATLNNKSLETICPIEMFTLRIHCQRVFMIFCKPQNITYMQRFLPQYEAE